MNERIRELAIQSRQEFLKLPTGYKPEQVGMYPQLMEKFAELIVKECMEVAIHKDDGMISTADIAGYMAAGRASAAKMIAKHFGVE